MSLTIYKVLEEGISLLQKREIEEAMLDGRLLLENVLGLDRVQLILQKEHIIREEDYYKYMEYIRQRSCGKPLQHILQEQNFMGLKLKVNENTLVPRPETEELVTWALSLLDKKKDTIIIDVGTGSGCIPVLMCHFNKKVKCIAIDYSVDALEVAMENAHLYQFINRIEFVHSDLFKALDPRKKADIIISNPPYIKTDEIPLLMTEVKDYEPITALDGGADGLDFYRRICRDAKFFLKDEGYLLFEIGYDQKEAVINILNDYNYKNIFCRQDLSGNDRMICANK